MGGVPARHRSKKRVGGHRSHMALKSKQLFVCENCGHPVLAHRYCSNCGQYKGQVIKAPKIKLKKS